MSLRPEPIGEIPAETLRVAGAAFPKGTVITRLRDEFSTMFEDADFRALYPTGASLVGSVSSRARTLDVVDGSLLVHAFCMIPSATRAPLAYPSAGCRLVAR